MRPAGALPYPSTKKTSNSRGFPQCVVPRGSALVRSQPALPDLVGLAHHGRHAAVHRRKGARRDAANQTWQRARGPGDARPTPRVLSRGCLSGDPRDRDLTIPASGHAGEQRSGFRHPASCPHVPVGGVPRSCVAANPLGACLCGAAQPPLHNAHALVLQCAHVLFGDVGQSQAREEGERPGFASGAQQAARICSWRWCPKSPESRALWTIIPGCTVTYACVPYRSNMPADTALASRTPVA